jgi:hypothetical protein
VLVAIMLISLVGVSALAVDGGRMFVERRREVRAADAAALAAALAFAKNDAQCGTNEAPAIAAANDVAFQNIQTPNAATLKPGSFKTYCNLDGKGGTVTVTYWSRVDQLFAPILGFPSNRMISATATARWGVAGAGHGIPIMLRQKWLDACKDKAIGTYCYAWLNDKPLDLGGAQWAFLNLRIEGQPQWGWDVPKVDGTLYKGTVFSGCTNVGTSSDDTARIEWINYGTPWTLPLNYPSPTYVCSVSGHSTAVWDALRGQIGHVREFPINCPVPQESPACSDVTAGQLDKNGNTCIPVEYGGTCTSPDKYDIVSFAPLQIEVVTSGNVYDYGTPGTPAQSGHCVDTHKFTVNETYNIDQLAASSGGILCPKGQSTLSPGTLTPRTPFVYKGATVYHASNVNGCTLVCDYTWDPATHQIKWLLSPAPSGQGPTIDFDWTIPGTPATGGGPCLVNGQQPAYDANAICLGVTWQGNQAGGDLTSNPGYDFGLRGVQLCDSTDYVNFDSLDANGQPYCPRS